MVPVIQHIFCSDIPDVERWVPQDEAVAYWLDLTSGLPNQAGGDNFQVCVATPEGLASTRHQMKPRGSSVPHPIVVRPYTWAAVLEQLDIRIRDCAGETWLDAQEKLRRVFVWEYEGMK
jgi:hypothetical protein